MTGISSIFGISCSLTAGAVLLLASAPLRAQPPDGPLSFGEALELAAEHSEQLAAQDAAAAAARDFAVAAGERADPTLTFGIENLPINGRDEFSLTADFMTMRSIGLTRELTREDKRDARAAHFARAAEAAEAERSLALASLQRATALAWLERYYRERMSETLTMQRIEAALQVAAADAAFRSGVGPQSDVFTARSAVGAIDDRVTEAERDIEIATIRLARWIGAAAVRPLDEPPATDVVTIDATNLESELVHHPVLEVLAKREEVARADVEIARAGKRPDWTVGVAYGARGSAFSDMVSVSASRPLQWRQTNRQDRELAARLALVEQLGAEREEETRMHLADARALLSAWKSNRARLERYRASLIPLARERTQAALAAYRGGGTLEAVLDARMGELVTRLDELALELETARLWAELGYLVPIPGEGASHERAATTEGRQ